ncbi:MAG: hypothetical protein KAY24_12025, partial [Candidatus Eisenbacteria sp.]|nr:hypothetical protein [Candidatus Eisenbacteria bacterium]
LEANGMLSVHKDSWHALNAVDMALSTSWLKTYTVPAPSGGRHHAHGLGFQLLPIGFESDRNFHTVDYTAGPRLTFSVPFLDWPLLLWHDVIDMPRGFLPPTVGLGYTFVHRVRDEGPEADDRHRVDGDLAAVAPILRPLDLAARYRFFYDLNSEEWEALWELSWRWHLEEDTRTAVLVKFVHGALPPLFYNVEMVGLGFELEL